MYAVFISVAMPACARSGGHAHAQTLLWRSCQQRLSIMQPEGSCGRTCRLGVSIGGAGLPAECPEGGCTAVQRKFTRLIRMPASALASSESAERPPTHPAAACHAHNWQPHAATSANLRRGHLQGLPCSAVAVCQGNCPTIGHKECMAAQSMIQHDATACSCKYLKKVWQMKHIDNSICQTSQS